VGSRVYARLDGDWGPADASALRGKRATALGMATVVLQTSAPSPSSGTSEYAAGYGLAIRPLSLRELLTYVSGRGLRVGQAVAPTDPHSRESWPSSLARRALARGMLNQTRYVATDWNPPADAESGKLSDASIAAAMWVHAIDGQSLGLVPGWRDLRDGSGSPYPTVLIEPGRTETIAHTALDLIRLGRFIPPLRTEPSLVVRVETDAIDPADDNAWASWIEPVWDALHDRQIRFDVAASTVAMAELHRRYAVVQPLTGDQTRDLTALLLGIERELARHPAHSQRVTAREPDDRPAAHVYVRNGRTSGGRPCAAVANLSDRARDLRLQSPIELGTTLDVVSGDWIADATESLSLAPWQVRLLWPAKK
jgi:hypothetical protein